MMWFCLASIFFLLCGLKCSGYVAYPAVTAKLLARSSFVGRSSDHFTQQGRRAFHVPTVLRCKAPDNFVGSDRSDASGDVQSVDGSDDDANDYEDMWDDDGNAGSSLLCERDDDITHQNLRKLCDTGFSHNFIGDMMAEMGVPCPIDFDARIGDYMTGEQIFKMLQSLNSLDPFEANEDFSDEDMYSLADEYELSEKKVKFICDKEKINLPFGMWTSLHQNLEEQFLQAVQSGKYDDFEDNRYVPNTPDIEAIVGRVAETMAAAQAEM